MPLQKIIHFLSERPFQSNVLASKSIFQPLRLIFQRGFGQVFRNYNSKINVQPRIYMLIPGTLYRYSKALSSRGAVKVSLMERVLFLSTEPGCRSTISKNCKHHYFSCKKVDTQQLKSWFDTLLWISLKWGWWGLQLVLHQGGQRAVAFPLPLSIHLTQKQAVMQKKVIILVNLPKYQTQALPRECLMAHFTSKNTFRMFWQGGCI